MTVSISMAKPTKENLESVGELIWFIVGIFGVICCLIPVVMLARVAYNQGISYNAFILALVFVAMAGVNVLSLFGAWPFNEPKPKVEPQAIEPEQAEQPLAIMPGREFGFIYVMRRDDGIYKIGRTNNIDRRINEHSKRYRQGMTLVKRFATSDVRAMESIALRMTEKHEYQQPGCQELRLMDDQQIGAFIADFLEICQRGVDA